MRYLVEVPVGIDAYGRDKSEWAMDTVTMHQAQEFSQQHLGEQIVSHRVVTKEEALKQGALAFFGQKYPDVVSVFTIGDPKAYFSKELCGGPHVTNTKELANIN